MDKAQAQGILRRINALLAWHGWSQEDLGRAIGVSQVAVSKGIRRFKHGKGWSEDEQAKFTQEAVAKAFGVTPAHLNHDGPPLVFPMGTVDGDLVDQLYAENKEHRINAINAKRRAEALERHVERLGSEMAALKAENTDLRDALDANEGTIEVQQALNLSLAEEVETLKARTQAADLSEVREACARLVEAMDRAQGGE